ncbi:MAG: saccharopine dehydrogenase NADP-binding domain-containing protein [Gammaproteobacteria bacterium]|nr:saccharopine dehydrogenase NADP-binding domain-containing protein [Gammaproteobacteria bacterium]MDE0450912.1 saccharopine dehydrogenase NADP-binding domain-containing protein [Gammaproteobacteria bacterium]
MHRVAVTGAGQIGDLIATLLVESGDYDVTLFDSSENQLAKIPGHARLSKSHLDVVDSLELQAAVEQHDVVVNAAPYHLTEPIARAASNGGAHYIDLTEDVASTRAVRALAANGISTFIPQCGLAPGIVSILAADIAREFEDLDTVKLKVGALPRYPCNALSYNLTWSPEGVVNEYCNPCTVIFDGQRMQAPPLEQRELLFIDGVQYESFNTSGGLGSLACTWDGKVRNLSYQSIRYPGHAAIMRALLRDLGLSNRRELLLDMFSHALPVTTQDVVIIFIDMSGMRDGRLEQVTYTNKIYGQEFAGRDYTAIQLCTASSACAVLDLLADGHIQKLGFVRQEDIPLSDFLANRFGRVFRTDCGSMEQQAKAM